MGYPMTYPRVIARNGLFGGYNDSDDPRMGPLIGDLRRLERDQRDDAHLDLYARKAGISPAQAQIVLDLFFRGGPYS